MARAEVSYIKRASCGACGAVIWTEDDTDTYCVCSKSSIVGGVLQGQAKSTSDKKMSEYILKDRRQEVTLKRKR